jgi:uncharacterized protein (TIGR03083 family)
MNKLSKRQKIFLERLTQARDSLLAVIEGLDDETLSTEKVMDGWTVKDILGHIVSWNEEFRANIAAILDGQHPGYDHQISGESDFSDSNQAWAAAKKDWPYERVRADIDRDYQEAMELIRSLKPADFRKRGVTPWKPAAVEEPRELTNRDTDSVETLVTFHWRHMNMHTRELATWRRSREPGEG